MIPGTPHMAVPACPKRWSYSSLPGAGLLLRLREATQLIQMVRRGPEKAVEATLGTVETTRRRVEEMTGMEP